MSDEMLDAGRFAAQVAGVISLPVVVLSVGRCFRRALFDQTDKLTCCDDSLHHCFIDAKEDMERDEGAERDDSEDDEGDLAAAADTEEESRPLLNMPSRQSRSHGTEEDTEEDEEDTHSSNEGILQRIKFGCGVFARDLVGSFIVFLASFLGLVAGKRCIAIFWKEREDLPAVIRPMSLTMFVACLAFLFVCTVLAGPLVDIKVCCLENATYIMSRKGAILIGTILGMVSRFCDQGLDIRTSWNFFQQGDNWWAGISFSVTAASPVFLIMFLAWRIKLTITEASLMVLPGWRDYYNIKFMMLLPQDAFDSNLHKNCGNHSLITVLAALEAIVESLPQAILQSRAFQVKGGDWLNVVSICFSLASICQGMRSGYIAYNRRAADVAAWSEASTQVDTVLGGMVIVPSGYSMNAETKDALLFIAPQTKYVSFSGMDDASFVSEFFSNVPANLSMVVISRTSPTCNVKEMLKSQKSLTYLALASLGITDHFVKELVGSWRIVIHIDLGDTEVTDVGVKAVAASCTHLAKIFLYQCQKVTDEGMKALATSCRQLSVMSFRETQVTDAGVSAAAMHLKKLSDIYLGATNVTDKGIETLVASCSQLAAIGLAGTQVTDTGVRAVATHCKNLGKIYLSDTNVTDNGIKALAKKCTSLKTIKLQNCGHITDKAVEALAASCRQLTTIDLAGTQVTETAIKIIAASCRHLTTISLNSTQVTDKGIEALVSECQHLTTVSLRDTQVTDEVIKSLSVMLEAA